MDPNRANEYGFKKKQSQQEIKQNGDGNDEPNELIEETEKNVKAKKDD